MTTESDKIWKKYQKKLNKLVLEIKELKLMTFEEIEKLAKEALKGNND